MIDYKFKTRQNNDGSWLVRIRIYRGAVTTENEMQFDGTLTPVTRYRRSAVLATKRFSVPAGYTIDDIRRFVNKRLIERAAQIGETVVPQQADAALTDPMTDA